MHRSVRSCPVYTWRTRAFGCASRGRLSRAPPVGPRINSEGRAGGGAVQRLHAHSGRPRLPDARGRARTLPDVRRMPMKHGPFRTSSHSRRVSSQRQISRVSAIYCGIASWKDFRLHLCGYRHLIFNLKYQTSFQQEISSIIYCIYSSIKINDIKRLVNKLDRLIKSHIHWEHLIINLVDKWSFCNRINGIRFYSKIVIRRRYIDMWFLC